MLSIEEIKLLIEKLKKVKKQDLQKLIDSNLQILEDLATAVDANNQHLNNNIGKTPKWFEQDLKEKLEKPNVDATLHHSITRKIYQFSKTDIFPSLEIGPGNGMFSKELRAWRKNFFLELLPSVEKRLRRRFKPAEQKRLLFYYTNDYECANIPQNSCNFIFSWDTFVFFSTNMIQHYLHNLKRVLVPGGYMFIQYADCHFDYDLRQAKRQYWQYNTKSLMNKILDNEGYEIIELNQFKPGANYFVARKPGNINPFKVSISDFDLD